MIYLGKHFFVLIRNSIKEIISYSKAKYARYRALNPTKAEIKARALLEAKIKANIAK